MIKAGMRFKSKPKPIKTLYRRTWSIHSPVGIEEVEILRETENSIWTAHKQSWGGSLPWVVVAQRKTTCHDHLYESVRAVWDVEVERARMMVDSAERGLQKRRKQLAELERLHREKYKHRKQEEAASADTRDTLKDEREQASTEARADQDDVEADGVRERREGEGSADLQAD